MDLLSVGIDNQDRDAAGTVPVDRAHKHYAALSQTRMLNEISERVQKSGSSRVSSAGCIGGFRNPK
jgi:hypothetical protein